jgi:hypothetical protein
VFSLLLIGPLTRPDVGEQIFHGDLCSAGTV